MKSFSVTIQIKDTEHEYFLVALVIMPYKVVLTFESVNKIQRAHYLNKSYWAVLSYGTVCYAFQGGSNFWVCFWKLVCRQLI